MRLSTCCLETPLPAAERQRGACDYWAVHWEVLSQGLKGFDELQKQPLGEHLLRVPLCQRR